jgi:molybdopterin converting factor small subunit
MLVTIELFGVQRDITKTNRINMPITEKTMVRDAIDYLSNKYPALSLNEDSILVTVNHELAPQDRLLKPNDVINFLPFIGGG